MKDNLVGQIDSQSIGSNLSDIDLKSFDVQLRSYEVARYASDTTDRKWLAYWTSIIVTLWLVAVILILFLNKYYIGLSDAVLIALLGTTTLNILGLSFIVLKGHFKIIEQ